jgi:hypothetical protein
VFCHELSRSGQGRQIGENNVNREIKTLVSFIYGGFNWITPNSVVRVLSFEFLYFVTSRSARRAVYTVEIVSILCVTTNYKIT